eukprot:767221-Hanusia_phi.AAC.3
MRSCSLSPSVLPQPVLPCPFAPAPSFFAFVTLLDLTRTGIPSARASCCSWCCSCYSYKLQSCIAIGVRTIRPTTSSKQACTRQPQTTSLSPPPQLTSSISALSQSKRPWHKVCGWTRSSDH